MNIYCILHTYNHIYSRYSHVHTHHIPCHKYTQTRKPRYIEVAMQHHQLDKYRDPDGDEAAARQVSRRRRERHSRLIAEATAEAAAKK